MADKRMFTMKIIASDKFKELPLSTQALYFHLVMNADDEGFLNSAKSVQRSICASEEDIKILIDNKFIIQFESGVIVIKHWKMHNTIQPSRIKPTQYDEEKSMLSEKENKAYTLRHDNPGNTQAEGAPYGEVSSEEAAPAEEIPEDIVKTAVESTDTGGQSADVNKLSAVVDKVSTNCQQVSTKCRPRLGLDLGLDSDKISVCVKDNININNSAHTGHTHRVCR